MQIKDSEKWEKLSISNDFIFSKLMRDEEICKKVLEVLLNFKISNIKYIEDEKSINIGYDAKSIRLDIYVEDENKIYNIEMQVIDKKDLAKRSRYYQSMIDLNCIEKGETYKHLKDSYIIFICTFDPFGKELPKYSFENVCSEDSELYLKDGAYKIFFNCKSFEKEANPLIKSFLKYINGQKDDNSFINMINNKIEKIKDNKEWRQEYMTLLMKEREIAEENFEKGLLEGIEQGKLEGIEQGIEQERIQSIKRQVQILKELGIEDLIIMQKIVKTYSITEEEVKKYL